MVKIPNKHPKLDPQLDPQRPKSAPTKRNQTPKNHATPLEGLILREKKPAKLVIQQLRNSCLT